MSVLHKIAHFQNRRDEVPNQELAAALVTKKDKKGIREIADNLRHEDPDVQSDCLKVLYEVGFIDERLITEYVEEFLALSQSKDNRLVWGSMIALSTIAGRKAAEIFARLADLQKVIESGSVITVDNGIKMLAIVASRKDEYRKKILPYLLKHLRECTPKDVPQHSEAIAVAIDAAGREKFVDILTKRMKDLTTSQAMRAKRVMKDVGRI